MGKGGLGLVGIGGGLLGSGLVLGVAGSGLGFFGSGGVLGRLAGSGLSFFGSGGVGNPETWPQLFGTWPGGCTKLQKTLYLVQKQYL
jgi:hypothetical protein